MGIIPPPPRTPTARLIVRAVLGLAAAALLGIAAFGMFFVGVVVFTGCFWACHDPDPHEAAAILIFLASAAAGGGAFASLAAGFGMKRNRLLAVFVVGSVASAAITSISFLFT